MKVPALAFLSCIVLVGVAGAQSAPASSPASRTPVELVGCVSNQPGASGAFTFDESTGSKYRLTGKSVRKYAGQMVRLVGGPQGRKLSVSGGLWPSANVAGQAGAIDGAKESIARQPGGGGSGTGAADLPEFRVVSVRTVDGSCTR
ncbi:MAG TPA: hypothetical protein VKA59_08300 [Vicinamibacterales bacterium]|nr:hypothetical protein [Vicinamibacterales bacterium]